MKPWPHYTRLETRIDAQTCKSAALCQMTGKYSSMCAAICDEYEPKEDKNGDTKTIDQGSTHNQRRDNDGKGMGKGARP